MKKQKPLEKVYALYDARGFFFGLYATLEDAKEDAFGPRFRPQSTVREYVLVPRTHHRVKV